MRKKYYVEHIHMTIRYSDKLTRQQSIETAWYCRDTIDVGCFDTYEDAYTCLLRLPVSSYVSSYETWCLHNVVATAISYYEYDEEDEDNSIDQYLLIRAQDPETKDEVVKFYDISGRELDEYEIDESFYSKGPHPRERFELCSEASK